MSSDINKFESYEECGTVKLNLADNSTTKVESRRTVKFKVTNKDNESLVNLENTLYVPDLRTNLLSVSKITNNNLNVTSSKNEAIIRDKNGVVKLRAERID